MYVCLCVGWYPCELCCGYVCMCVCVQGGTHVSCVDMYVCLCVGWYPCELCCGYVCMCVCV